MDAIQNDSGFSTKKIPGVDVQAGLALYCGETDIYWDVLLSFVQDTPEVIESMRRVTKKSLPEYAINVHGFKGTCTNICAEPMRKRALNLEMKAKAGDLDNVLALNEAFLIDAATLVADIKSGLQELSANMEYPF